ncbi:MAG: hypothetical protein P794_07995 [Epsilonproteobacteria bacterium (ex Lamellibrachia satsuma)]|nr:MAG: hypothetical protein P794_07995 [Epsilonproteobacteria bacterium (ex Lamellibrachia satsuma)]
MTVAVKKWGNSLAIRIPKDVVNTLSIEDNSLVELNVEEGVLKVEPKKQSSLEALVSGITEANLHSEVDTGSRVGNEER